MAQGNQNSTKQNQPAMDDFFGSEVIRRLPSMPVEIACFAASMALSMEATDDDWILRQTMLGPIPRKIRDDANINAVKLRESFLAVTTPEQAARFLKAGGRFRLLRDGTDEIASAMTWKEFQLWQQLVRIVLLENFLFLGEFESPKVFTFVWGQPGRSKPLPEEFRRLALSVHKPTFDWLQGRATDFQIVPDESAGDPLHRPSLLASVMVDTCLDAILASIYIDTQVGIQYELCALPDCTKVYEVKTSHQRAYCSQACAHKASVRRRRAEWKEMKSRKVTLNAPKTKKGK